MTELENVQRDERLTFVVYILLCIIVSSGLVAAYSVGSSIAAKHKLFGFDGYVHLTRATDLYETGNWYHPARMKSNTPYGDTLPWTRPFDVLLLAGAVPLSAFMGFESALFWWGVAVSPILFAITLIALHWASRDLLSKDAVYFIVFIVGFQLGVATCFKPARPDHHSLLALLFVLMAGYCFRLTMRPFNRFQCWMAGLTAALAVWVSIESMVMVVLMVAILSLFWVWQKGDFLQKSFHFCAALCLFVFAALLLERPLSDIATAEYDRISIVHGCFFAWVALFWIMVFLINGRMSVLSSFTGRFGYGIAGGAIVAFVMWLLFPKFYQGPLADVNPRIYRIWLSYISELQPLFPEAGSLMLFIQALGSLLMVLVFVIWLFPRIRDTSRRNGWLTILALLLIFFLLAAYQVRWLVYPQILLSIILAELLCRILSRINGLNNVLIRALSKSAVILIFSLGLLALGFVADEVFNRDEPDDGRKNFSLVSICEYLNEKSAEENKPLRILTEDNFAAEILYRTDCEVVGSNYHRNGQGIVDNYTVLTAERDQTAFEILKERQIDLIMLSPRKIPKRIKEKSEETSTFCQRLLDGKQPDWLKQVELPKGLKGDFLMFKTNYEDYTHHD